MSVWVGGWVGGWVVDAHSCLALVPVVCLAHVVWCVHVVCGYTAIPATVVSVVCVYWHGAPVRSITTVCLRLIRFPLNQVP